MSSLTAALKEVSKIAKKAQRITLYKHIWARILYWQNLRDVSDAELASYLKVGDFITKVSIKKNGIECIAPIIILAPKDDIKISRINRFKWSRYIYSKIA